MCGFYGHGFMMEERRVKELENNHCDIGLDSAFAPMRFETKQTAFFDFEHNSHHIITSHHKINEPATRIGFRPDNLRFTSNDSKFHERADSQGKVHEGVVEDILKINAALSGIFVSRWQIVQWIKKNYGANGDMVEWQKGMTDMLRYPEGLSRMKSYVDKIRVIDPGMYLSEFLRAFDYAPNDFWSLKSNAQKELPETITIEL